MKLLIATISAAALAGLLTHTRADEKTSQTKGTLTMDGKTYKLESALAYEMTKFDKKRTVVYLSEKALDTSKLKESFRKNGNDDDFFVTAPHVGLIFDDKGELFQLFLYARGSNVILQGDPDVKANAAAKDGTVKGAAKLSKPDKDYSFETTFEVKLTKP